MPVATIVDKITRKSMEKMLDYDSNLDNLIFHLGLF